MRKLAGSLEVELLQSRNIRNKMRFIQKSIRISTRSPVVRELKHPPSLPPRQHMSSTTISCFSPPVTSRNTSIQLNGLALFCDRQASYFSIED